MLSRHGSQKLSESPSHSIRDRKAARHSRHHSHALSPDHGDDHPNAKRISTGEAKEFYQSQLRDSPVMNQGNIDASSRIRKSRASSTSSKQARSHALDAAPHVPTSLQENEKIRQLEQKVNQQNELIQETMARMAEMEARYKGTKSDEP